MTLDKETLPPGPWMDEVDHRVWKDEATGYKCMVHRNRSGAWCGYVQVPEGHGLHGADYSDRIRMDPGEVKLDERKGPLDVLIECLREPDGTVSLTCAVDVHGGLTYSGDGTLGDRLEPDGHWFGFDCSHDGDMTPSRAHDPLFGGGIYRNLAYVERNCAYLARQLADMRDTKATEENYE